MGSHAILSPSAAERWMACPGAPRMERGLPDTTSEYADEGTAAHFLAALCLTTNADPVAFFHKEIGVWREPELVAFTHLAEGVGDVNVFKVDEEMVGAVRKYVNGVRDMSAGGDLFVEQRLSTEHVTDEPGGFGTSDAVAIVGTTLKVRDLKYGQGVLVSPEENKQLMIYGLSALDEYSMVYDIKDVELSIHQPRVSPEPLTWTISVENLERFREQCKAAGFHALQVLDGEDEGAVVHHLRPGEEQCKWCKAKADCPALSRQVQALVVADFEDLSTLPVAEVVKHYDDVDIGAKLSAVDMIETWCSAVRGEAFRRLNEGIAVPGFKLVQGKRGNRKWRDEAEAEQVLKTMRLKHDEMYDYKVISPTKAEKLSEAGTIGPRQWPKVQALFVQADGKPSIAPADDMRPALEIKPVLELFEDLSGGDLV